jgi:hypothetical protein
MRSSGGEEFPDYPPDAYPLAGLQCLTDGFASGRLGRREHQEAPRHPPRASPNPYPDQNMLNYIIDQVLVRNGRYMIGLWHSHPGQYNSPSYQDLTYCSQIIANDNSPGRQWNYFLAPITTFDATGRDVIAGWILPKGGSAFHSANVITDRCHDDSGRQPVESTEARQQSAAVWQHKTVLATLRAALKWMTWTGSLNRSAAGVVKRWTTSRSIMHNASFWPLAVS